MITAVPLARLEAGARFYVHLFGEIREGERLSPRRIPAADEDLALVRIVVTRFTLPHRGDLTTICEVLGLLAQTLVFPFAPEDRG